ncbi:MAG: hypothetical protein ACLTKG_05245 [Collinsella intestinalis]
MSRSTSPPSWACWSGERRGEIDESLKAYAAGRIARSPPEFRAGARHHAAARAHCQLGPSVLLLGLELVVYPFHVGAREEGVEPAQPSA